MFVAADPGQGNHTDNHLASLEQRYGSETTCPKRGGELVKVLPGWRSPEIGVYVLMPSKKFLDAKTRALLELLKSEVPIALGRDADDLHK